MYGMFLFGNNFGFGGFGCNCFCRPMISPFMLGAMQGYNSAMCAYSMMGGMFSLPSLFNFNMNNFSQYSGPSFNIFQTAPQAAQSSQNNQNTSSALPSSELFEDLNSAMSDLQQAVNGRSSSQTVSDNDDVVSANNPSEGRSSSHIKGSELKIDPDFMYKVQKIASDLNCNTEDLLAVMNAESGLDAQAENISGRGAVGLIQFTDVAVQELNRHGCNVTKEQLKNMDALEQLDYVEKYLKIAKSYKFSEDAKLSAGDLYAIVYLPGRADREVLSVKGENYYNSNIGLDINRDGKITKAELENRVNHFRVSVVA